MKKLNLKLKVGALHRSLGISQGKKIPHQELVDAAHSPNKLTRRRAQFALNAAHWKH